MALDERLLSDVKLAASRVGELEQETALAITQYHRAVRRLHVAGCSMREIAQALQLSHQRVHQIVEESGGPPRRWKIRAPAQHPLVCSFCERSEKDVPSLVAGRNAYICGDCIAGAGAGRFDKVHAASTLRCSFCSKPRRKVARMVAGVKAQICEQCLRLCKEISD